MLYKQLASICNKHMLGYVCGHSLFLEVNSFPKAALKGNCELIILQIFFATCAVLKIGQY